MLQHFEAVRLLGHSAQGQTLPLILDCVSESGQPETFQVKVASRRNGLTDHELACEGLCTVLARSVGLHASIPASVSLSEPVQAAIERRYSMNLLGDLAAGVLWIDYLRPLVLPVDISSGRRGKLVPNPALHQAACRTLALDLLLCNGDRTPANPNLAWDGDELLVFDFEHCLELPVEFFARGFSVHLELLPNLRESHIFGEIVSTQSLRIELTACLDSIGAFASRPAPPEGIPGSWKAAWTTLSSYLGSLAANPDVIIDAATAEN